MLPKGTLLQDRYNVIEQIGQGGMGAVYRALDTRLHTIIALKQTLVPGEPLSKDFERKARLLAGLRPPALPRVSDHFNEQGGQFLVMEYIPGDVLGKMIEQRGRHCRHFAAKQIINPPIVNRHSPNHQSSLTQSSIVNPPIVNRQSSIPQSSIVNRHSPNRQ
jgi:hypothetical protein